MKLFWWMRRVSAEYTPTPAQTVSNKLDITGRSIRNSQLHLIQLAYRVRLSGDVEKADELDRLVKLVDQLLDGYIIFQDNLGTSVW